MNYLSVCSGIEAASMAWHPMGWSPVAFSEIEPFPSAVLAHHYPTVPNLGDMTKFKEWKLNDSIDLLVGGTPCQSFSVAGLRKGLDDPRGNLMLTYLAIADQFKPKWLVWENVPGVLSSNGGKDFGSLLGGMAELGYGFAYCILDAQFFGVPQRRRRVFVVGCLGDWRAAAAVLFDKYSMQGNPAPKREKREDVTGTIGARTGLSSGAQDAMSGHMIPEISRCLVAGGGQQRNDAETETLIPTFGGDFSSEIASTLDTAYGSKMGLDNQHINAGAPLFVLENQPISFSIQSTIIGRNDKNGGNGMGICEEIAPTLTKADQHGVAVVHGTQDPCTSDIAFSLGRNNGQENALIGHSQVRRLTPVECARLQGFPDAYLDIPYRNRPAADGPKYKALGNSMAVPVMAWIGKRIQMVEELTA